MNKEEFAKLLSGREYGMEITKDEERIAKESGLIVIFGYSDDNVELRGVLRDEISSFDGACFVIAKAGDKVVVSQNPRFYREIDDLEAIDLEPEIYALNNKNKFEAVWSPSELECSWLIKTEVTHATFDIFEDGELFCRGVVIEFADLA